jgi:hypothetical protein
MNDKIQAEKARLVLEIGLLCRKPPPKVVNGSIQATRDWLAARKDCLSCAKSSRSSVPELSAAESRMRSYLAT